MLLHCYGFIFEPEHTYERKVIVTEHGRYFCNDAKTYNQPRFMAQYQELKSAALSSLSPAVISITSLFRSFLS
ncbi:hypothetical protein DMI70_13340 [Escherichia coli]|nr:hypothetical protein [Escherichia coli]